MRLIGIILILIGAWSVWSSYKDGTLRHNTVVVIDGIKKAVVSLIKDETYKAKANNWFEKFESFIGSPSISTYGEKMSAGSSGSK